MTVAANDGRKTFAGDDVTTSFGTSPVEFYDTSDLTLYVVTDADASYVELTEGVDYTVTGGDGSTGTIDTTGGSDPHGALLTGTTLVVVREMPLTQTANFVNNDIDDAEVTEEAFDRLTLICQQLSNRLDRAVRLHDAVAATDTDVVLPTPEASKFLAWNTDADGLTNVTVVAVGTIAVTAFAETLLDDTTAANARTTLGAVGLTGNETVAGNKTLSGTTTFTGDINFDGGAGSTFGSDFSIVADTADGADNLTLTLCGGGASGTTRGATLLLRGNEVGGGSNASLTAGDTGDVNLIAGSAQLTCDQTATSVRIFGLLDLENDGQIAFPAAQNASSDANTLDDYEEGDWTPTLTFGTPGNVSVAYTTRDGDYVKIGQFVAESFNILTSAFTHTTASGNCRVTGSSFTKNNNGVDVFGSLRWGGITKASYTNVITQAQANTSIYILSASGSGQAASSVTASDMPTGGTVTLMGTCGYRASA